LIAQSLISDKIGLYFTGAPALAGEQGYSIVERIGSRPNFDNHGIVGGAPIMAP